MTTFTRKELVNTAINDIKTLLRLYVKNKDILFIHEATTRAQSLGDLNIIKWDKVNLLTNIINNTIFTNI